MSWGGGGVESVGGVESGGGVVGVESLGDSFEASEDPLLQASAPTESENRLPRSQIALRAPGEAGFIRKLTNPSAKRSEHSTHYRQGAPRYPTPVHNSASLVIKSAVVKAGHRTGRVCFRWKTGELEAVGRISSLPAHAIPPPLSTNCLGQAVREWNLPV